MVGGGQGGPGVQGGQRGSAVVGGAAAAVAAVPLLSRWTPTHGDGVRR